MNLGRVIGRLIATEKSPGMEGQRILCVQPLGANEAPFFSLDAVGSGAGETVLYIKGREASFAFLPCFVPCDACIVGIVDSVSEH